MTRSAPGGAGRPVDLGGHARRRRIHARQVQRGRIDVEKREARARCVTRGRDAAGAAPRAHVDDPARRGQKRHRLAQEAGEAKVSGPKKTASVSSVG